MIDQDASVLSPLKNKKPHNKLRGFYLLLAERVGFAYIPQAAVWLASQTLRIPHVESAGTSLVSFTKKNDRYHQRTFHLILAGHIGLIEDCIRQIFQYTRHTDYHCSIEGRKSNSNVHASRGCW